jgi:hypothetical protein
MTSLDGSKAWASAICIGTGHLFEAAGICTKKWLAAAHFGGKILPDIKVLAGYAVRGQSAGLSPRGRGYE